MMNLELKRKGFINALKALDYDEGIVIGSYVGKLEHRLKQYRNLLESLSVTDDIAKEIFKEQPDKKIIDANDILQYILRKINDELERGTE